MSKIDYQTLLAMRWKTVVKDALIHAQFNGLERRYTFLYNL